VRPTFGTVLQHFVARVIDPKDLSLTFTALAGEDTVAGFDSATELLVRLEVESPPITEFT
jgi:hypothetical protein